MQYGQHDHAPPQCLPGVHPLLRDRGEVLTMVPANRRRTIIYVDGFNLYYGVLKDSKYK